MSTNQMSSEEIKEAILNPELIKYLHGVKISNQFGNVDGRQFIISVHKLCESYEEKQNVFKNIGDTNEAAKLWNMSVENVKRLAQNGEINAKKIGNSWAIDLSQPNPKKYRGSEVK